MIAMPGDPRGSASAKQHQVVEPVTRKPAARSGGHNTPVAKRQPENSPLWRAST
jgi:hypothetical protein